MKTKSHAGRILVQWRNVCAALLFMLNAQAGIAADIVVGQVAPFSGSQAVTGRAIHAGAKLYFDAVNAKGGVRGQQIKFVTRDDAQKPEESVRLIRELIAAEAPVALLGMVGTANLEAVAKDGVLMQKGVSMVGGVSGATSVAKSPGIYVVKATYRDEIAKLFSRLSTLGILRAGLLYQDDAFGIDILEGAEEAAKQYGIQLAVRASYPRNTADVAKAVAEISKAKVQVVFMGATTAAGVEFFKQFTAGGGGVSSGSMLYGTSVIDTDVLLKALGPERARGYAFSVVLPAQNTRPIVREYQQLRSASNDPNLSSRSMEGFVAAKALVKVMETTTTMTPAGISAALASAKKVDVGDYVLDFTARGKTASSYVDFAIFGADGKLVR